VVAAVLGGAFVIYLAVRLAMRARASRKNPGLRVIPTGNPLVWLALAPRPHAPRLDDVERVEAPPTG
jgi:hypothetical protein